MEVNVELPFSLRINYQKWIAIFCLVYPLVISNSRMRGTLPGYQYFGILANLPSSVVLGLSLGLLMLSLIAVIRTEKFIFIVGLYAIFALTFVSKFVNETGTLQTMQGLFYFIGPLLMFSIGKKIDSSVFSVEKAIDIIIKISIINLPIAYFLYFKFTLPMDWSYYNPLDAVSGLFAESHAYAFFILFVILLLFFRLSKKSTKRNIFLLIAHLFLFIVTYNEKLILLSLIVGFCFVLVYGRITLKFKIIAISIFIGASIYGYHMVKVRLGNILKNQKISELPVFEAFYKMYEVFNESPNFMLYGAGFGEYGTVVVNTNVKSGHFPELAKKYNYYPIMRVVNPDILPKSILARYSSSIQISFNTFTSFLIEAGLFTGLIYFLLIGVMFRPWMQLGNKSSSLYVFLLYYFIVVLGYSFISMFGSIDDFVPMVPMLFLLGLLHTESNEK